MGATVMVGTYEKSDLHVLSMLSSTHCRNWLLSQKLNPVLCSVLRGCQEVEQAALADVIAVRERDPACTAYSSALLYYKGYHALQTHRIAHGLWERGQTVLARSLQVTPLHFLYLLLIEPVLELNHYNVASTSLVDVIDSFLIPAQDIYTCVDRMS